MAYPDGNIDITAPADNDLLAEGDDAIREFKRQVLDRLDTIVDDAQADPMVLSEVVDTAQLVNKSVTTAKLDDDAVTGAQLADDAVGSEHLEDGAVIEAAIADSAVTTNKINAAAVTGPKLADNSVSQAKMTDSSVGTAELIDGEVTAAKLDEDSVTTPKILDENVTTPKLADGAVTEDKIADGAVTPDKFAASATALLLEQRFVDITHPGASIGTRSTVSAAGNAFSGLENNDMLVVSLPTQYGDLTDGSQRKLLEVKAISYTDQFTLVISNPNDGPLSLPAGTYRIYCIKPATDW